MGACLMAAIHEGLPLVAQHISHRSRTQSPGHPTLRETLAGSTGPTETEAQRLEEWLRKYNATLPTGSPPLETSPAARLTGRWEMIRRLRFDAEAKVPVGSASPVVP
jgi:hypothetical protein